MSTNRIEAAYKFVPQAIIASFESINCLPVDHGQVEVSKDDEFFAAAKRFQEPCEQVILRIGIRGRTVHNNTVKVECGEENDMQIRTRRLNRGKIQGCGHVEASTMLSMIVDDISGICSGYGVITRNSNRGVQQRRVQPSFIHRSNINIMGLLLE